VQRQSWGETIEHISGQIDLVTGAGRCVALVGAILAEELGFTDVDGRQPRPLSP
jgi:hypothetical protein